MSSSKFIFKLSHNLFDKNIIKLFDKYIEQEYYSKDELIYKQEQDLQSMINHCYNNVPYYKEIFDNLNLKPTDIQKIQDLSKLPILNKEIIKSNYNKFIPTNLSNFKYREGATGGTTGVPFKYRVDHEQRVRGIALLYKGFQMGGYNLGDKILFLGGSSIGGGGVLTKLIYKYGFNFHKLSSFDMEDSNMEIYYRYFKNENFQFIRGYASSIYYFAKYIANKGYAARNIKAIFTTSEKLHTYMREEIENVFQCRVFDQYGLADGGLTAFECEKHQGMHIDTQNAVLEIVDERGNIVQNEDGRVLATSLYNYAMPFIRYETGDIAIAINESCSCNRNTDRIVEIVGRSVDVLITPSSKKIHGWFFLYIFWQYCKGIKQYQVVQEDIKNIHIKIVKEIDFDEEQIDIIKKLVSERAPDWNLHFEFVDTIPTTKAGKYKFIINNMEKIV